MINWWLLHVFLNFLCLCTPLTYCEVLLLLVVQYYLSNILYMWQVMPQACHIIWDPKSLCWAKWLCNIFLISLSILYKEESQFRQSWLFQDFNNFSCSNSWCCTSSCVSWVLTASGLVCLFFFIQVELFWMRVFVPTDSTFTTNYALEQIQ